MYIASVDFSIWCDFIERDFLDDSFMDLINDQVVNGATSNPAIFAQSFLNSPAYKEEIEKLKDLSPKETYETLATEDIKKAAKKLLPLYKKEDDGFVSIEIDPFLANDVKKSIEEGRRLIKNINMPNVMVKVPATEAGYEIMEALMGDGIHINATLIFSPIQAQKCLEAMKRGSESFLKTHNGQKVPKGVISIFVSRFDRKLDPILKEKCLDTAQVGIMNATRIYNLIEEFGLENVRALFASTGVKGKSVAPEYYVEKLLFPNVINTAPLDTINAFIASGKMAVQVPQNKSDIEEFFKELQQNCIDMDRVYAELLDEGLKAFENAFSDILELLK